MRHLPPAGGRATLSPGHISYFTYFLFRSDPDTRPYPMTSLLRPWGGDPSFTRVILRRNGGAAKIGLASSTARAAGASRAPMNSDKTWQHFGDLDPYYGVLT